MPRHFQEMRKLLRYAAASNVYLAQRHAAEESTQCRQLWSQA